MQSDIVIAGVVLLTALACSKDPAAAAEPPRAQVQDSSSQNPASGAKAAQGTPVVEKTGTQGVPAAKPAEAAAALSSSDIQEVNFGLSMKPSGTLKAGKPGIVLIELVAKAPFKVNQEYPYKFKVSQALGLKVDSVINKDHVTLEKKRAVMKVQLTPESSGSKKLEGKFLFSVCTDERCLIEKRDLGVALNVD